jgi:TonB family protein
VPRLLARLFNPMVRPNPSEPFRVAGESLSRSALPPSQHNDASPRSCSSITSAQEMTGPLPLDQLLDQVAQQACLATAATAAAIALKQGDEIVCRATSGVNTPDLGVRLNTQSGLSGACVQTGKPQYCEDTETDPRVDAAICRRLQVRSVLVSPFLQGEEVVGVFEIFSPLPQAFAKHDLENLQALSRTLLERLQSHAAASRPVEPVEEPLASAEPETCQETSQPWPKLAPRVDANVEAEREFFSPAPESPPASPAESASTAAPTQPPVLLPKSASVASEPPAPAPDASPVSGWDSPAPADTAPLSALEDSFKTAEPAALAPIFSSSAVTSKARPRDWATGFLTLAVITLALLLGWLMGRAGWQRAERAAQARKIQDVSTARSNPMSVSPAAKAPEKSAVADPAAAPAPERSANPVAEPPRPTSRQPKNSSGPDSGGLVVYQDGKVIFQQASPSRRPEGGAGAPTNDSALKPENADAPAPVLLSSQQASLQLLQRVEPVYPEQAREKHIQGDVVLDVVVGKNGDVQRLTLISGDPALASAASDAVRQWRFKPYELNGKAVAFSTRVSVEFRLP